MTTHGVSFLVVIWRMSRQAENTLWSLSARFQRNVTGQEYEIIVVENRSDDLLGAERARAAADNVRYFLRDEHSQSPVSALNFAFEQSTADVVCLMVDGARMVTPRVVEHALLARRVASRPLIAVPSYHLGATEQHRNVTSGYDESTERALLERIDWKRNGYDLFTIGCFSEANAKGFLCPMHEASCLFCTRESYEAIGMADERFDLPGGGSLSIHLYAKLASLPGTKLIVLGGEGSFHQFHGGVTTTETANREAVLQTHREQLAALNSGKFEGVHREPLILGVVPVQAREFLKKSADFAAQHAATCRKMSWPEWYEKE